MEWQELSCDWLVLHVGSKVGNVRYNSDLHKYRANVDDVNKRFDEQDVGKWFEDQNDAKAWVEDQIGGLG